MNEDFFCEIIFVCNVLRRTHSERDMCCTGSQDKRAQDKIAEDIIAEDIIACGQNSMWKKQLGTKQQLGQNSKWT